MAYRFGSARGRTTPLYFIASVLLSTTGCGGNVVNSSEGTGGEPAEADGGGGSIVPTGGTGGTFLGSGGQDGSGGEEPYIEPECPDVEPLPVLQECDPLDPFIDCPAGEGCYPYLEYPFGEGCGRPAFGSICAAASSGEQGDFCGDGGNYCSPGYMCVVGATGGKRCGQICEPVADHGCPAGLVCGETDVQGYGVCF